MASQPHNTNVDLSKPNSFATSSSEYTLLMNRFKLLNLVQRIAHRDVLAMIETIGLDGLHYKCTIKQPWMMDWNMNADNKLVDKKEEREKNTTNKARQNKASSAISGNVSKVRNKFSSAERDFSHGKTNENYTTITASNTHKSKQAEKKHANARRDANATSTMMHYRHHKSSHEDHNNDHGSKFDVALPTSSSSLSSSPPPRLTQDEINKLVERLAQPRASYTIDMDETSYTTEEDMSDQENVKLVKVQDNVSAMVKRDHEIDKNEYQMLSVQPAALSMVREPAWKQLQMATGLMESAPLPLHTHGHEKKQNRQISAKSSAIASTTTTASNTDTGDDTALTSSPRPRSRTRIQESEEEEKEEEEQKERTIIVDDNNNNGKNKRTSERTMSNSPLTLEEAKMSHEESNRKALTQTQQEPKPLEHLESHLLKTEQVNNMKDGVVEPSNASNEVNKVNMLPITPTRAIAPKAKPIAAHNTERVPTNIIQHAAALVARQREQRQMELTKRQIQLQEQHQQVKQSELHRNVKELASTQRYLPTQLTTHHKNENETEEVELKELVPPSARSYSVAQGHDADKLFETGRSDTDNITTTTIISSNTNKNNHEPPENEKDMANVQPVMEKGMNAEVTTSPSLLPRATFADQRTLAKLSNTIDHMLRDHVHILHEVIADPDMPQSIGSTAQRECQKDKEKAVVPKETKEQQEKRKKMKQVKSAQQRHLHRFSAFASDNIINKSKHIKSTPSSGAVSSTASAPSSSSSLVSSFSSNSLSPRGDTNKVNSRLFDDHTRAKKRNKVKRTSINTMATTTTTTDSATSDANSSSSTNKHKDYDELLMLSRMQRTFAKMDNETHDIIARTSQASLPAVGINSISPRVKSNASISAANSLHYSKQGDIAASLTTTFSSVAHRRRGQMPEVAVRRLNAYRVENLERIAREERQWNNSNISQFTFASRLTNTLFEDCFDEVMSEVNSIMDNYVDGLAQHEMT